MTLIALTNLVTWRKSQNITSMTKSWMICCHNKTGPNILKAPETSSAIENYWRLHNFYFIFPLTMLMQSEFSHCCKPSGQRRGTSWLLSLSNGFYLFNTIKKKRSCKNFHTYLKRNKSLLKEIQSAGKCKCARKRKTSATRGVVIDYNNIWYIS
jgi:hypothetical protein